MAEHRSGQESRQIEGYEEDEIEGAAMPITEKTVSMTWKARLALLVIVGGAGLFIIASYAGIFYWPPVRKCRAIFCDPYHWQILAIGIAFFCAGLAYVIPERFRLLGKTNAAILVIALLSGIVGSFAAR